MKIGRISWLICGVIALFGLAALAALRTALSPADAAPVVRPVAVVETTPVPHDGDSADDPAVWIHPTEPGKSLILGTDKLNAVGPWLPAKRGRLWLACGDFIEPVQGPDKHAARAEMAARIEKAMVELYARLRRDYGLEDSILP